MNYFQFVFQDWRINKGNIKGRIFLMLFRAANFCSLRRIYFYLGLPYLLFYKVFVQWLFTLEVPWTVKIGKDFSIYHGQALILNNKVVIGEGCTIRHCTTIGVKQKADGSLGNAPVIGNHVDIGSNVCIIGAITIGDYSKIGSGSVVIKDVNAGKIVAGNPAVEIRKMVALKESPSIVNSDSLINKEIL